MPLSPLFVTLAVLGLLVLGIVLLFRGHAYWAWVAPCVLGWVLWGFAGTPSPTALVLGGGVVALPALLFGVRPLRRRLVAPASMPAVRKVLPELGDTERVALEAGGTWWDGDLFSGLPRWRRLLDAERGDLDEEEQRFLDGPVEELCRIVDEWRIQRRGDLPEEAWELIRRERMWGLIIPEEYGGLGFSAAAQSAAIVKLASRSVTTAVTMMVPNSLGPAELLLEYGTEEQKERYLGPLARGEEVPCFALTEPEAGSDAAGIDSVGVVCEGEFEGETVLGMRLEWNKRYITLGPVATLLGLAFRLQDPDHLLGDEEDLGITCALVPTDLPGIEIGERHDPLGIPFQNGPNRGRDVFLPLDAIIGGPERAGDGWRMLMECLAAGRSVSMPSLAVGSAQLSLRVISAYVLVRRQFGLPIGRFGGVQEPLVRAATSCYLMNAARRVTVDAVDRGDESSVLSAVVKCWLTESMREVVNDAMDLRAGGAIVRGPRNMLAPAYQAVPIGITVEGANILARSLIVYGQGAIRCHPYVLRQIHALEDDDVAAFDHAFFRHVGHPFVLACRALWLGLSGGRPGPSDVEGLRRETRRLNRLSTAFALVSEGAMLILGGALKRRERITGRLADALAWLYLGSAVVADFEHEGRPEAELPLAREALDRAAREIEAALLGVLDNLPLRPAAFVLRRLCFPFGTKSRSPHDARGHRIAEALLEDENLRERLTRDVHVPPADELGLGILEDALAKSRRSREAETKMRHAIRDGVLEEEPEDDLTRRAVDAGVLDPSDARRIERAETARRAAVEVDAFQPGDLEPNRSPGEP